MISKLKTVYYCEHCKKKGMVAIHIKAHEEHCCSNPARKCQLCAHLETVNDLPALVAKYKPLVTKDEQGNPCLGVLERLDLDNDLKKDHNNVVCPNCKLAVLRQIGVKCFAVGWDYKKEIEAVFASINEARWEGVGH